MSILLITPPLLQLNTPYPATPVLLNLLRRHGFEAFQCDLAIETALAVFTPEILRAAADKAAGMKQRDDRLEFFLESVDDYCRTLPQAIEFLQGKRPELQWRIAARNFLPEGPYFQSLYNTGEEAEEFLGYAFGRLGTHDQAKYLASLYLDDLTFYISATLDSGFGFGKYEAHLGESLPAFEPLLKRLKSPATAVDAIIERLVREKLAKYNPDFVGITIPFPGTLYGAFRIAAAIREAAPQVKIIFGGGYVNSELRDLEDRRVFDFADYLAFDDGLPVLAEILNGNLPAAATASEELPRCQRRLLCRDGFIPLELKPEYRTPPLLAPDYDGLDMNLYFDVVEMPNPLHRIWSDGRWLKMQLAQGCYWHKCAFCDLALDYIGRYEAADAVEIVNEMERLMQTTGHSGFHFVDEAIPPALAKGISKEIIRRKLNPVWWGNVRFDSAFTPETAQLMADAGCIAVTGGLECADDRLLKLMNKGITLDSAQKAFRAFAEAGILVHTYLMYAFPTETQNEVMNALDFVRRCFAQGLIHSAFWHRFALTTHSGVAAQPEKFGIRLQPDKCSAPRFALNEIRYSECGKAPNWDKIGRALSTATYNYMLGLGLDLPVRNWLK